MNSEETIHPSDNAYLKALLAPLDRDSLQTLLLNLMYNNPPLVAEIALEITKLQPASVQHTASASEVTPPPPSTLAPAAIRKQVRTALKAATGGRDYGYWDDDGEYAGELEDSIEPLIELAEEHILAGVGRGAFPILEAITDALIEGWDLVEDVVGEAEDLFMHLGNAWSEAFLTAELSSQERQAWAGRLEQWRQDGRDAGAQYGLAAGVEAAIQGWDYPPLVRVLKGEITENGAWEDEAADGANALASARLNILERQGRLQEAAYLARAEGHSDRYLDLLLRLGRPQEAADSGLRILSSAGSALILANKLHQYGETSLALRIAEHGLRLSSPRYYLATWLRDTALDTGDRDLAIRAAKEAIHETPKLDDYKQLQQIAADQWPALRAEILTDLQQPHQFDVSNRVDIFLYEGMHEEALNAVRNSWNYDLVARVVEAVTPTLPLEVLPICKKQAAQIMDAGKADRYHHAARWVERARNAYRVAGQENQWQAYKAELLSTHHRKYKLVPMLRTL